eukprot:TRINITY_DN6112_c0_g1_i2.p1 TRINITY_DN6112_c0_g1~~TRINITY_DN6112_c0_g1_i2.p1  ORF type:complete len:165 (+),score=27.48 TRINITY_DN6112_c0_g1_i2:129-623(+)
MGIGAPRIGSERRFVVKEIEEMPLRYEEFDIEQMYLESSDKHEPRITKRTQSGASTYNYSVLKKVENKKILVERPISGREYNVLSKQASSTSKIVKKKQRCFLWENQSLILNYYTEPVECVILEANSTDPNEQPKLPPFIKIEREVTGTDNFTTHKMSTEGKAE